MKLETNLKHETLKQLGYTNFSVNNKTGEIIFTDDSVVFNEEEFNLKLEENRQNNINSVYKKKRALNYPSIGDQLDALFHAGVFPEEMAAQIQAIKDRYPKPE